MKKKFFHWERISLLLEFAVLKVELQRSNHARISLIFCKRVFFDTHLTVFVDE